MPIIPPNNNPLEPNNYIGILDSLHLNYHQQNTAQTIILTNLPSFLRGVRVIRDASFPCSSARTVHVGCCLPNSNEEHRQMKERGLLPNNNKNDTKEEIMKELGWKGAHGGVAVVKMGHFSSAQNFAGGILELVKFGKENKLPGKPIYDSAAVVDPGVVENDTSATTAENGEAATTSTNDNGEDKKQPAAESQYTKEEQTNHYETLSQLKNMQVYHLFNHQITTNPTPPDMKVPMADPTPNDPTMSYQLLETLTALRLKYELDCGGANGQGLQGSLSTGVDYVTNDNQQWGGHAAAAGTDNDTAVNGNNNTNAAPDDDGIGNFKMDMAKIKAAAGGVSGYDEDADPLNAPEVIKCVVQFKRRLEDQNFKGKKRRVEIINDRMSKKVKELIEQGRKEREAKKMALLKQRKEGSVQQPPQQDMAPPPPPPPPVEAANDTGRRGVSNLPAWMTKKDGDTKADGSTTEGDQATAAPQAATSNGAVEEGESKKRKFVPSEANRDINVRKQKLDMVEGGKSLSEIRAANEAADKEKQQASTFVVETTKEGILAPTSKFPTLPSSSAADTLKKFVTSQIVEFLGEKESSLIDFIMKELQKEGGCTTTSLLEEMKQVLDEDAEDMVLGLYRKMTVAE